MEEEPRQQLQRGTTGGCMWLCVVVGGCMWWCVTVCGCGWLRVVLGG